MPEFIKGLELSKLFYWEAVRPILDAQFSNLPHAVAKIGAGSDVLGFDSEMSRDHDWGPSLTLLLQTEDMDLAETLKDCFAKHLPLEFHTYSTHFVKNQGENTFCMQAKSEHPIHHKIDITTVDQLCEKHLGVSDIRTLSFANWLSLPSQSLLELTAGEVFHDDLGELTSVRQRLDWYPHDVGLYIMAAAWQHITENQPLMSRAGFMGDEMGSSLIASNLIRIVIQLCFLQEKQYAPYPKWFGTAFRELESANTLLPIFTTIQQSNNWVSREAALNKALLFVAQKHNQLAITKPLSFKVKPFFSRPFKVLHSSVVTELLGALRDSELKKLSQKNLIGSIDLLTESTALKSTMTWQPKLEKFYEP